VANVGRLSRIMNASLLLGPFIKFIRPVHSHY